MKIARAKGYGLKGIGCIFLYHLCFSKMKWKEYNILLFMLVVLVSCKEEIDPSLANTQFGMLSLIFEFITVFAIIIGGYFLIIFGVIMTLLGLSGNIEWVMESASFSSRLVNASPGILMIIVGAFLVSKGKMDVKATKSKDPDKDD